jgi:hypothetical protein
MIEFDFEIKLRVKVSAGTAIAAYKKLLDQLPSGPVSNLEFHILGQTDLEAARQAERKDRKRNRSRNVESPPADAASIESETKG